MNKGLENILSNTSCPSPEQFDAYVHQKLSRSELHAFESHLNDCPFCQEALEGFEQTGISNISETTATIHHRIEKRTASSFSIRYLAVAASALIVLFVGSLWMINHSTSEKNISMEQKSIPQATEETIETEEVAEQEAASEKDSEENVMANGDVAIALETSDTKQPPAAPTTKSVEIIEDALAVNTNEMVEEEAAPEAILKEERMTSAKPTSSSTVQSTNASGNRIVESESTLFDMTEANDEKFVMEEDDMEAGAGSSSDEAKEMLADASAPSKKEDVNVNDMLSFASAQINASFTEDAGSKSKREYDKKSQPSITYSNTEELREQLNWLQEGKYKESLTKINFLVTKDVWTHEEQSTLIWFKSIAKLQLGESAQEELKTLKQTKNPYQDEAKKLYNQLY